jgi:hypothetical protein
VWKRVNYEETLQLGHLDTVSVVKDLGLLHQGQGKLDEVETIWKWALEGYGSGNPNMLTAVETLGVLFHTQGSRGEAEMMLERALAGVRKS